MTSLPPGLVESNFMSLSLSLSLSLFFSLSLSLSLFVNIYIYMYIYIYFKLHTCMHTYLHIYIHGYIHTITYLLSNPGSKLPWTSLLATLSTEVKMQAKMLGSHGFPFVYLVHTVYGGPLTTATTTNNNNNNSNNNNNNNTTTCTKLIFQLAESSGWCVVSIYKNQWVVGKR